MMMMTMMMMTFLTLLFHPSHLPWVAHILEAAAIVCTIVVLDARLVHRGVPQGGRRGGGQGGGGGGGGEEVKENGR